MNGRSTILIVDDEPLNIEVLETILEDEHRIVAARSGADAIAAARKHHPGLILLDVRMPGMDGLEVCCRLKADPATESIPVIFVTALDEISDEASGFTVGAVDYLTKPVSPSIVRARVRTHLSLTRTTDLERSHRDAIRMLAAAGHHNDTDTGVHVWRMAAYTRFLARVVGWPEERCQTLELAATMHDTGKIGIPERILRKPGPLDPEEWEVMKGHSRIGWEILSQSDAPLFVMAAEIALHHHEKWDGSGYPDGLAREGIEEPSRIVAIADVFDALSMRRPYKDPWPLDRILDAIRGNSGHHFEPRLVEAFFDVLAPFLELREEWNRKEPAPVLLAQAGAGRNASLA